MPYRQARVGENEALFREVNETVASAASAQPGPVVFLCECGRVECAEDAPLTLAEYDAVRAAGNRFLVKPGHDRPDTDTVVEKHEAYWVVEKHGHASERAHETDPRSERSDPDGP